MIAFLLAHLWTIIAAVIGVVGTGGAAFAVFGLGMSFPAIVALVIGAVRSVFSFFETPIGQVVGILLLCAIFLIVGVVHTARVYEAKIVVLNAAHQRDIDGLNAAWRARIDKAAAAFRQDRKNRDDEVRSEIGDKVADATKEIAARAAELKAEVKAYAKLPHQKCVLGPADLDDGMRAPRR
jgi:ABC-type transport system involved in cytochrome bd biosynthesis fused ATPase/permease subunit